MKLHDASLIESENSNASKWRVADAINCAIRPWLFRLVDRNARTFLEEGRVDFQLVSQVIAYASRQGLAPADFDNLNGNVALRSLVDALAADGSLRVVLADHSINMEWKSVEDVAHHLLQTQPRRYEVEK